MKKIGRYILLKNCIYFPIDVFVDFLYWPWNNEIDEAKGKGKVLVEGNTPVRQIKGIGGKTEELFHNLEIYTAQDVADHFPLKYADIGQVHSLSLIHI